MTAWSPAIANDFIRLGAADGGRTFTQMQLQKLVYIAHGWNLAINNKPLTADEPQAWEYGPVYPWLWEALRGYGRDSVTRLIRNRDFDPFASDDDGDEEAFAPLSEKSRNLLNRVYKDYAEFKAFQLSALTHRAGTPWTRIYGSGNGKFKTIPADLIREHFVELAATQRATAHA